jgi:hypothetical protein
MRDTGIETELNSFWSYIQATKANLSTTVGTQRYPEHQHSEYSSIAIKFGLK